MLAAKCQITTNELHNVMSEFGLTDKELDQMIKEVDSDGDASIDFEEFMKLILSTTTSPLQETLNDNPQLNDFEVSMEAKLSTVVDGASLRLFFWKLHNTVSSSIARSEEWYHKDEKAFYTTRYWPSLDSELARSKALKHLSISVDRLYRLYGILKPASRLAGVRATLQKLLEKGDSSEISEACTLAEDYIKEL